MEQAVTSNRAMMLAALENVSPDDRRLAVLGIVASGLDWAVGVIRSDHPQPDDLVDALAELAIALRRLPRPQLDQQDAPRVQLRLVE